MLVSTRRNDSFPKWGRQFPQVGTTVSPSGNDGFPKRERRFPQVGTAVTTSRIQKNTYFSPRLAFCRAFLLPLPAVLVSPLPILLEKSDENGNQVQILNRPAAVNPSKSLNIFYEPLSASGWEGIQRGISQKTCQDNIVLVLSGNKATKHRVGAFFIHIKESFSLFIFSLRASYERL